MREARFPSIDFQTLETDTRSAIKAIIDDPNTPRDLRDILSRQKFVSDLPTSERQAALETTGSAMCPVESDYVVIGFLGSVWCDCRYRGRMVRIGINPNPTAAKKYAIVAID